MPNDNLIDSGFISLGCMDAATVAERCRDTAGKLYGAIVVNGTAGTMKQLLLDAAATIEDTLKTDALQGEKGAIVEADLQDQVDILTKEKERLLQETAQRFKMLQKARDALELAAVRFGNLSLHDDSMRCGIIPSVGCGEAVASAHEVTWHLEGGK